MFGAGGDVEAQRFQGPGLDGRRVVRMVLLVLQWMVRRVVRVVRRKRRGRSRDVQIVLVGRGLFFHVHRGRRHRGHDGRFEFDAQVLRFRAQVFRFRAFVRIVCGRTNK